jgi:predicted HicB family RNase H-like nuclease
MKKNKAPKYTLLVEWSEEDQTFIGRCPELFLGGVHGPDRAKVYAELCEAVDEHIAIAAQDGTPLPEALAGKKFSGKFILRTTPQLHRDLAIQALSAGDSLNNFVVKKLQVK